MCLSQHCLLVVWWTMILSILYEHDVFPIIVFYHLILCSSSQWELCWHLKHLHKGRIYICWHVAAHAGLEFGSVGWIYRQRISLSVNIAFFTPLFSLDHRMGDRIRKRSKRGVIGVHALCIISYSEEDSAASGNESGQQCTEVNAGNANEGAALAGRYIWLKAQVMVNTAQWCYQQKHTKVKDAISKKRWVFVVFLARLKIKDLITDKRAESLMSRKRDSTLNVNF